MDIASRSRVQKGQSLTTYADDYTVIDIETTGLNPKQDEIIEISALKYRNNEIVDKFSSLIKPESSIPDYIIKITGIDDEMVSSAPGAEEVLTKFHEFIGDDILIGHNINFDINFLYDNFDVFLNIPLSNDYIDTLRIARRTIFKIENYKLGTLADYFDICYDGAHRAEADCIITNGVYKKLREIQGGFQETISAAEEIPAAEIDIETLPINDTNPFFKKKVVFKGKLQSHPTEFFEKLCQKCNCKFCDIFYKDADYIVFGNVTYQKYLRKDYSEKMLKAKALAESNGLAIISEYDFLDMLDIPHAEKVTKNSAKKTSYKNSYIDTKSMTTENDTFDISHPLYDKMCVFTGTLEKMSRKEAMQKVLDFGGEIGNGVTAKTNYLILGNNDYCPSIKDGKSTKQKKAEELKLKGKDIEIITEDTFYDMLEM